MMTPSPLPVPLPVPFPKSYWVLPGTFLAGEYPASAYFEDLSRTRLGELLAANMRLFIDLTEPGQLPPYEALLREQAGWQGVEVQYQRFPIADWNIPPAQQMTAILNTIDGALAEDLGVYVHCWAGIGRTGTVVGCFLVRHGLEGATALQEITRLREGMPNAWMRSPENDKQAAMILSWKEGQ